MGTQLGVARGVAEELHNLLQFLLLLVGAGHVLEGDLLAVVGDVLDARLAEAGHLVVDTAPGATGAGDEVHQQDEGHGSQHIGQQGGQPVGASLRRVVVVGDDALFALAHHQVVEVIIKGIKALQLAADGGLVLQLGGQAAVGGGEGLHLFLGEILPHPAVADVVGPAHVAHHLGDEHHRQQDEYQQQTAGTSFLSQFSRLPFTRSTGRPASFGQNPRRWPPACAPGCWTRECRAR